jgi:dephospho-CoA kinase
VIVIGLTGGIGMGKSTVANLFRRCGLRVFDADAQVRALQAPGGAAIPMLAVSFPGSVRDGVLDRAFLRQLVLADPVALRRLEFLMHPLVHDRERRFRQAAQRAGATAILLDIPLLFETGGQARMDVTITVSAPSDVQIARVRKRGLAPAQIAAIIAKQMPDAQKRSLADYVIQTGLSRFHTWRAVRRILEDIRP